MGDQKQDKKLHIAMYPWFALGHMTPFLHLANKLAKRGHKVSFFLPTKAQPKLAPHNHHPNLITFITVNPPHVDGLPDGAQLTSETLLQAGFLLMDAMDLTRPIIDSALSSFKPDLVFFDYAHWIPGLARKHRAKSIYYSTTFISFYAYMTQRALMGLHAGKYCMSETELMQAPPGFPSSSGFMHRAHEARGLAIAGGVTLGVSGMTFPEKMYVGIRESDAVCCRGCREMEGLFGEYFEEHYRKPVLWAGPVLPEVPGSGGLDEKLDGWLKGFEVGSVVYCALGSECVLSKDQFQELVLGLELTGLPFLAVLKSPLGCETINSALPQGFSERTQERGIIQDNWLQQHLILKHSSVGCFVTHCGSGSLLEAMISECQLVLLPRHGDQYLNARLMGGELRVGVEVEKGEEDGLFTKEAVSKAAVSKAIKMVMDVDSELGRETRANHAKWRELLIRDGFEETYIDDLIQDLKVLVEKKIENIN